jgi:TATA-box binding protein (TBP) (component of TFIID and TFIIIB)
MNPTPLRISTMTVTGSLGVAPNLQTLYDSCHFIPYWYIGEGIIKIQYSNAQKGISMEDILHKTSKEKKSFFNQSSLVFRSHIEGLWYKEINIKLFKNGGFQMTGISSEDMARNALTSLIHQNVSKGIWPSPPTIASFSTRMINSDYTIGKAIRRDRLHQTLVETYGLWSSYEPTIYQGVNTKFFWNKSRPAGAPPGICVCPNPCNGGGSGYKVGDCKKITISPFRTGSIIITGAKHIEQLQDAYIFINDVLTKHADTVLRDEQEPPPKKKPIVTPTTTEGVIRQRMRASPRNIVICGKNE